MDLTIFAHIAGLAALGVVTVQEILKLKFIPIAFANKYPVPTNILLSVTASIIVVWTSAVQPANFAEWLILGGTISVVAAIIYNNLLRNWAELRAMEGN